MDKFKNIPWHFFYFAKVIKEYFFTQNIPNSGNNRNFVAIADSSIANAHCY